MKSRGKKDISYWILVSLIILIFILGFLEWRNLELPKARGENIPAAAEKIIVLNFDDGPRPAVLKNLLPLLEKYDVRANFFMEGSMVLANKELVRKMHDAGHGIENHSWGHENFKKLFKEKGADAIRNSVLKTETAILNATGIKPKFFRPPFWEINPEIEQIIKLLGYTIMKLDNPDINTMDYDDSGKNHRPEALVERVKVQITIRENKGILKHSLVFHELRKTIEALKILIPYFQNQGYTFVRLDEKSKIILQTENTPAIAATPPPRPDEIRAIYLGTPHIFNERKITELQNILATTSANGIVIDFKDSNDLPQDYLTALVTRFKKHGAYVIARIVTFQDSRFARKHPEIAIKTSSGDFWYSGRKSWKRYWLDPASELAQDYNIQVAKQAINCGFDEIQFDYIRFPTDGNMKDIRYPSYNPTKDSKNEVMEKFFKKIRDELKAFSPEIVISIDVFGEVLPYGEVTGIGQSLEDAAEYFDIISPMAYPSHYQCGEFGLQDPTAHPYKVYYDTIKNGLIHLQNKKVIIRPWVQDFTIRSIYNCGPTVVYTKEKVLDQIRAGRDLGVNGFMLWNAGSNFTKGIFE